MRANATVAVVLLFVFGPGLRGADEKGDARKIQGTWKIVAGEYDGASIVPEEVKDGRVVITADKLTLSGRGPDQTLRYKLDPTRKPKAIDLIDPSGKDTRPGIYELHGADLKLCYRMANVKAKGERPNDFSTGPKRATPSAEGPGLMLLVLKREKR